jgi:hypothetical protein
MWPDMVMESSTASILPVAGFSASFRREVKLSRFFPAPAERVVYRRPIIHFAATIISQTATDSTVSTMAAISSPIDRSNPSSSR